MRLWKTTARRFVATQGVIPRDSVERLRGRGLAFLPGPGPSCVGQGSWPGSNRRQRRAASSSARSRSTVINAFRSPLSASILSRHRRVTSTGRKRAGAVARAGLLNRRKQDRLVTHRPASGVRPQGSPLGITSRRSSSPSLRAAARRSDTDRATRGARSSSSAIPPSCAGVRATATSTSGPGCLKPKFSTESKRPPPAARACAATPGAAFRHGSAAVA